VTDLAARGVGITLPLGWEGRVFRRPAAGEVGASAADGRPAPPGEVTNTVLHAATIPLPPDAGDFASSAVPALGPADALVVLVEYDPANATTPLFAQLSPVPRRVAADDFSPRTLQRALPGQAGYQRFANEAGRAFCLYVVLGGFANRARVVTRVNAVLATLTIAP
jgi:hypothetical protein